MAINRSEEGTTIEDLLQLFADLIEPALPLGVFIIITLIPGINILSCIAIMLVCLYVRIKDIQVK